MKSLYNITVKIQLKKYISGISNKKKINKRKNFSEGGLSGEKFFTFLSRQD